MACYHLFEHGFPGFVGKHVDYITNQIVKKVQELLAKKKKGSGTVKASYIRDNIIVFVNATIENPGYSSQCKETLETPVSKFGSTCEVPQAFVDKLAKSGLIDKVLEVVEFRDSRAVAKQDGRKVARLHGIPKLDDATYAGTAKSSEATLVLTEGLSPHIFMESSGTPNSR
jgi:DNA topoisomerase-2